MGPFVVIGAPGAAEFLESGADPCFGKSFAKTTVECVACRAPVLMNGKIILMRELCVMKMKKVDTPIQLVRLTSTQVLERLERGESVVTIFKEILGDAPPDIAASAARTLLIDRLIYLKSLGQPTPEVPKLKEMSNDGNHMHKTDSVLCGPPSIGP